MDTTEIQKRLDRIREKQNDPEMAHIEQDRLYLDLLTYIAGLRNRDDLPPVGTIIELCRDALLAEKIEFPRWYA